jgi:predicted dienelactone hydrolase
MTRVNRRSKYLARPHTFLTIWHRLIFISSHGARHFSNALGYFAGPSPQYNPARKVFIMHTRSIFGFRALTLAMAATCVALLQPAAHATEAGFRQMTVAANSADSKPAHFALYYPTPDAAQVIPMGPFPQTVAINGAPEAKFKGLLVISHGTASTEIGFGTLAQALARNGYLVASVEHVGDTWQDQSMRATPARYFTERPRQASRVIDTVLADPQWRARIANGADGQPLVGALGHSAGGYTVLALAGGKPVLSRMRTHCDAEAELDPILCKLSRTTVQPSGAVDGQEEPVQADTRVRAVMALAPMGVAFSASSLASITVPVAIYAGEKDTFLVPRFHAQWVMQNMRAANTTLQLVPNAGHYAFMNTPTMYLPSPDGNVAGDPQGFDRAAFLDRFAQESIAFFDKNLR